MAKIDALVDPQTLNTIMTIIAENNDKIVAAIMNTLSRDGSAPNYMEADLDMNGNCLINVGCLEYVVGGIDNLTYLNACNQYVKGAATEMHTAVIVDSAYTPVQCDSNVHKITLTENITINAPTGPTNGLSGQVINFIIKQDETAGHTVTWDTVYRWPSGTAPTITATSFGVDVITAQYDSDDGVWLCCAVQDFQ